jgi:hypothetical protein
MSALGIGLAWALMAMAAFMALSASALAKTRHELEVEPRAARAGRASAPWPEMEVPPASPVLRSSPSVSRMHLSQSHLEPVLLS